MPGVGGYFRPDDPLVAQRRALQWAGVGDVLRGGSGANALQGIQQLQQQQAGQELLGGLLGGAPTGGTPPFVAPGSQRAQPLSQPSQVTTTPISDDPIVRGAADAINRSGDPTLALIRGFEGFRETPYWDVNALRTGYGSDTITLPSGEVQRVTEGTRVSREDAERDLVRRVRTEFAPRARQDVSPEVYDSLNPQQQAALNSLAYNYGKVPERVSRVARTGDVQATAQAIAGLASDNEGVNASRRRREAQVFAGGAGAAPQQAAGQQIDPNRLIQILQHPGIAPETKQFVLQRYGTPAQAPKPTDDIQEYLFARNQGYQGTFQEYQQQQDAPTTPAGIAEYNFAVEQGFPGTYVDFQQAKKGRGFEVTLPDGTTVAYGGAGAQPSALQPSSPEAMIDSITGILEDPALETSTGIFSFLQEIPGTEARRFGARAAQLEGQAFLQAFESLKGGGQITEIEGRKATQAIGRLDTSQSPEDYREALTELRDLLIKGRDRPVGWAETQGGQGAGTEDLTDEELLKRYGG